MAREFGLEVRDVMTYPAITEDEDASVAKISKDMKMSEIGSLVITKEDKPVGIVTDRDIVIKVMMKGRNPGKLKVKEIMSSPLVTIEADTSLRGACKLLLEKGIRRLLVIEDGELVGIVSLRNIVTREPMHVRKYLF
uniref:Inosine-5'-monophosphate dehydrogenase n=1 Tax=Candidatus Methanophagaceae archaeon ANME-1 ERB6 TaxID=2759912 RepID=A0A7G9YT54_9EURY|nr:inosine-5'-monophosphate dehydrogenase [Methanosarcinales archaeon ANME-1 ERB6]